MNLHLETIRLTPRRLALIAVLGGLLTVVTSIRITRETHKTRGKTEVTAMFAQLAAKEELYKETSGAYLGTMCPAVPDPAGYNFVSTCISRGSAWELLGVSPPESRMFCSYSVNVGAKTEPLIPPEGFKNSIGGTGPEADITASWWYMLAWCDEDGAGGTYASYYASSVDPTLQVRNAGR